MLEFITRFLGRWLPGAHGASRGQDGGALHDAGLARARAAADSTVAPAMTPMLDCEAVMRQLWDYLDGELTSDRMSLIAGHLDLCKRCDPHYDFERSFLDAIAGSARAHSDPERLRATLLSALRARGLTEA